MMIAMIALMLATTTLLMSRGLADDVIRLAIVLISRFCLFISLVYAPWFIKLLILVAILVMPVCTQRYGIRRRCSHRCLVRFQCPYPHE